MAGNEDAEQTTGESASSDIVRRAGYGRRNDRAHRAQKMNWQ
jgi:hypothetical protein